MNRRFQMQVVLASALAILRVRCSGPIITRKRRNPGLRAAAVVLMFLIGTVPIARAQNAIAGHVGFVIPWVTYAGGQTTSIADNFVIGFPIRNYDQRTRTHGL